MSIDPLSAMVMVAHAAPTDLAKISLGLHKWRVACVAHWEATQHRISHQGEPNKWPPGDVCRIIARDGILDELRAGRWVLEWIRAPVDHLGPSCRHCAYEERNRGRSSPCL